MKDIFDTHDMPTDMGSPIYRNNRTAADASCVALVRAAGAVILGKTITCEFAGLTPNVTRNPHDPARTPGGSSSGSAAAVADRMVHVAFGTQTGGSVLRPASFCGVVGYKPTYNIISRGGMKFAAESRDTIGLFARTVEDVDLVASVLTGREPAKFHNTLPKIALCRTHLWDQRLARKQARRRRCGQAPERRPAKQRCRPNSMRSPKRARSSIRSNARARWRMNGTPTPRSSVRA